MREIVGRYVKQILDDDVPGLAAELAYRFMFATFPFAIFVVALSGFMASWLGMANPGDRIIGAIGNSLPPDLIGPVTTQLDDLLASAEVKLSDEILDQIDEIVPPGTDVGTLDQAYVPPALQNSSLRRRPVSERGA